MEFSIYNIIFLSEYLMLVVHGRASHSCLGGSTATWTQVLPWVRATRSPVYKLVGNSPSYKGMKGRYWLVHWHHFLVWNHEIYKLKKKKRKRKKCFRNCYRQDHSSISFVGSPESIVCVKRKIWLHVREWFLVRSVVAHKRAYEVSENIGCVASIFSRIHIFWMFVKVQSVQIKPYFKWQCVFTDFRYIRFYNAN